MTTRRELARFKTELIEGLFERMQIDSPPKELHELLSDIAHTEKLCNSLDDAQELVDELIVGIQQHLNTLIEEATELGVTWTIDVFGSSNEWVRGSAYKDETLSSQMNIVRSRRAQKGDVKDWLDSLDDPYFFEALCTAVLKSLGCENPRTSWKSNDGGIDFYGRLSLQGRLDSQLPLGGFDRGVGVWLIGQAKHYPGKSVGVGVIREMVGSVELARTGSALREWPDLDFRPFDPVIMLCFTTGEFSRNSINLLNKSGMLSMNGEQLATYLCDVGLGFSASTDIFDPALLVAHVNQNSNSVH